MPPLRERRQDIAALATQFLQAAGRRLGRVVPKVPQREMAKLVGYEWPGNVRELQHVVERAVILAPTGCAIQFDVAPSVASIGEPPAPERPYRTEHEWQQMERDNLLAALQTARGKVTGPGGAAELLGVNPNTLASRLRALGLKKTFAEQRDAEMTAWPIVCQGVFGICDTVLTQRRRSVTKRLAARAPHRYLFTASRGCSPFRQPLAFADTCRGAVRTHA